jgi:sulfur-carrier protein
LTIKKRNLLMNIKLFGITKEIVGDSQVILPDNKKISTVGELKSWLFEKYPELGKLNALAIAVDHEYAEDQAFLTQAKEVALIPPVSGG